MKHLWGYFLKGLFVVLPLGILFYFFLLIFNGFSTVFSPLIIKLLPSTSPLLQKILSFLLMVIILSLIGYFAKFLHPWALLKRLTLKIPFVKIILGISQGGEVPESFADNKPVLVRMANLYFLGLLRGETTITENNQNKTKIKVFLPSTPIPGTGYITLADPCDVKLMENISIPQLFAFVASYGVRNFLSRIIAKQK